MTEPAHAVFLSYASQDRQAAQRICESLRAAGIEVWFDQSELRGGEAWDRSIHEQIQACALFMPIISANAHARIEGYFRLEWKLAVDRSHRMAPDQAFLLPVVIDDTRQNDTRIPDRFHDLQWIRLPAGVTTPAFIARVRSLLSPEPSEERATVQPAASAVAGGATAVTAPSRWSIRVLIMAIALAFAGAVIYVAIDKLSITRHSAPPPTTHAVPAGVTPAAAFNPPPHSIAVLPFVDMSEKHDQAYFSDGLTEELLNSLSRIDALQVAARTSSFSFAGEHPDIAAVAHRLNVGAVLEGSVRRSGHTIRVTTQLINAVTGFHMWSETYDRDLGDVLKLQTEIATAVASALRVALLGDEAAKIEAGGTHNPAAFDAYLRTTKTVLGGNSPKLIAVALDGYAEAIRLDPDYALAYAARSLTFSNKARLWDTATSIVRADLGKAQSDATRAIALAPDLSEGYLARAVVHKAQLEFKEAGQDYERALALAPGNARVLRDYGGFAVYMSHGDPALTAVRRAVVLDPLNFNSHSSLSGVLQALRRYPEALAALKDAEALPSTTHGYFLGSIGAIYYLLGDFASARSTCEQNRDNPDSQFCLALVYDKLGRHGDAEAELKKFQAASGDAGTYAYALIYAQWGNRAKGLEWLDTAMRSRHPDLLYLKTDPLLDPLRKEPRFQAIERELKFPN